MARHNGIIDITERSIEAARLSDTYSTECQCPIEVAMSKAGYKNVMALGDFIKFRDPITGSFCRRKPSKELNKFKRNYDEGQKVDPLSFDLNLLEELKD